MNVWGLLLAAVGFFCIYIGVKGNPSKVVDAFRPAGASSATSSSTTTTSGGGGGGTV